MDNSEKCLIVILNWKSADETVAAIEYGKWDKNNFDVLIFDNEATSGIDGALERLINCEDKTISFYLSSKENLGFSGGCNEGLKFANDNGYGYILFLNNDALLGHADANLLLETIKSNENIGLCSPVIKESLDALLCDCGATLEGGNFTYHNEIQPTSYDLYLYGTALMARADVLMQLNGFDDEYFAYWEDFDLCRRFQKLGFHTLVVEGAYVYHQNNRNDEKETRRSKYYHYYMARNGMFFWKSIGLSGLKPLYWHYKKYKNQANEFLSDMHSDEGQAILEGLKDGLLNNKGKWRKHP